MCGIAACAGHSPAAPFLADALVKLQYRGYDSWGASTFCGGFHAVRSLGAPSGGVSQISSLPGTVGVGHTRWATHGEVTLENTHPIAGYGRPPWDAEVMVVHNGVVENYEQLKDHLRSERYVFRTRTDTEVISHLLGRSAARDSPVGALRAVAARLKGGNAFAAVCRAFPDLVLAFSDGSPLVVTAGGLLASDAAALSGHASSCYRLCPGEMAILGGGHVCVYDRSGRLRDVEFSEAVPEPENRTNLPGHFMLREIMEQPGAVLDLSHSPAPSPRAGRVVLFGCGSSYNAALLGRHYFERLAGIPASVEYATEMAEGPAFDGDEVAYLALTQSGETRDVLIALERLSKQARDGRVFVLTNNANSQAARMGAVVPLGCGPEYGVAATKTFTAQAVRLYQMARSASPLGSVREGEWGDLESLADCLKQTLEQGADFPALPHNVLFLGRGRNYAAAREAALKVKEVCYRHAEAMPAGELKHGPLALIEPGMLSVFLASGPRGDKFQRILSNVSEVVSRKGDVFAVCEEGEVAEAVRACLVDVLGVPKTTCPFLQPLVINAAMQLMAYRQAASEGKEVDRPRNLAKAVSV